METVLFREATFDTGKVVLNYAEGPASGPPLVVLHGGSGRWQLYFEMLAELAKHCHVYAPDLRGHGKSGWVPWGYTIRDYVDDIAAFLQEISGPAVLMGHSLGGIIAVATAKACSNLVRALIVGDAPLDAATWGHFLLNARGQLAAWRALSGGTHSVEEVERLLGDAPEGNSTLREIFGEGSPIIHELAERLYIHDPDMLGMLIEDYENVAAGYDMETVLPAIHCPVLLVQADPSVGGVLRDEEVQRALHLLANPTHKRFSGMGHMLIYDPKGPPIMAVNAFLNQLS
ncbi:MAG TPA: alpha/beta hydrolase [Chloroflexota bacterium]|nr:alpha/beta hydrolase [Chloroflexota bacterium]HUM68182.1 alpha/beta hydrolase [Chloroflexota bacterium]